MGVRKTSAMGLPELRQQMAGLSSPALRLRMSNNLAEEARTQIANGFRQERDPYGKPWAPIHYRQGMILQDTGRLRACVATRPTANGFRIDMPVAYAADHQYGATMRRQGGKVTIKPKAEHIKARTVKASSGKGGGGTLPQRQMIPMESTGGLGPIWTPAFRETAIALLDKYAHGGAS